MMEALNQSKAEVQTTVLYNDKDAAGRWILLRVEIGSWVTLKAAERGPWTKDARIHGDVSFASAWKAQIQQFRRRSSNRRGREVLKLDTIKVRHAYQRRQLQLDSVASANEPRACNLLYASYWDNWVPPSSVLDVILVLHHEIGEAARNRRSHKQLLENGTFFVRAVYVPRSGTELYGSLEVLPLPALTDLDWPVPDMHTSEAFRLKLAMDIAAAMKGGSGSKAVHVQWFMPVHVMVDLFAGADMRRTRTMYIFSTPSDTVLCSLMDPGWDEKWQVGQDILKCVVSRNTVNFRYHLARQVLYINFSYVRYRREEGQLWVPLDQVVIPDMISITVVFSGGVLPAFEVGRSWPVSHIREEISILLPREAIPEEYDLVIERPGHVDNKINNRQERCIEIGAILPPLGRFKIVAA